MQAVALAPACSAPLLLAGFRREDCRSPSPFRLLYAVMVGAGALVLVFQIGRGRSISDLLGAYSIVGESEYEPGEDAFDTCCTTWPKLDLYTSASYRSRRPSSSWDVPVRSTGRCRRS